MQMVRRNLLALLVLGSASAELRVVWRKRPRFLPGDHPEILEQLRLFCRDVDSLINLYSGDRLKRHKVTELMRAKSAVECAIGLLKA